MLPRSLAHLPPPPPAAQALSAALEKRIRRAIEAAGGWLDFARYMELALYAPGYGYYSAGSTKLGEAGDFVTAPELSALYARSLARQVAKLVQAGLRNVVEVGAGSGALAADLLKALQALDRLPDRYLILEVSGDLRKRQRTHLAERVPQLVKRVQWLDSLPSRLSAVLLASEVLDAVPTHIVRKREGRLEEMGVVDDVSGFKAKYRSAMGEVLVGTRALALPDNYKTELNLAARAMVKSYAKAIDRGALFFFDYGFPAAEYYHPQRSMGTLMCHYRHHAHDDPFALVGLQDITAHVDFSAIAAAGAEAGLQVLGYTTQAQFLVNCGITEILAETPAEDAAAYAPLAAQAQKLLSPAEMGELFKVIALGKGLSGPLLGFARGDKSHTL